MEYPYFRFTDHAVNPIERRANDTWLEHFKSMGIPACIAKSVFGQAVWRIGHEHIAITACRNRNNEPLVGEILASVNGFKEAIC